MSHFMVSQNACPIGVSYYARTGRSLPPPPPVPARSVAIWRYFSQLSIHFCGLRPPLFVVAEGHNTREVTEILFAAFGRHRSLWPKATTIERSQIVALD